MAAEERARISSLVPKADSRFLLAVSKRHFNSRGRSGRQSERTFRIADKLAKLEHRAGLNDERTDHVTRLEYMAKGSAIL